MRSWPGGRTLLVGATVLVLAVVVAALLVLDSPAEERRRRLDERRVRDLHAIADAIDAYRNREGGLPPRLDVLAGWQRFAAPRTDPVTGAPYRYRVTGKETYELCATFSAASPARDPLGRVRSHGIDWRHPAGDYCFELEAVEADR